MHISTWAGKRYRWQIQEREDKGGQNINNKTTDWMQNILLSILEIEVTIFLKKTLSNVYCFKPLLYIRK